MLDDKKLLAIELLADGSLTKTAIAQQINCSRQSLYNWMEDPEFVESLDKRLQSRKKFVEKMIDGKLEFVVDELLNLAINCDNSRVKADILKYLADRALGKTTQRVDVTASMNQTNTIDDDVLEAELLEFEEGEG